MLAKSIIVGLFSLSVITEASVIRGSPFDHILNRRTARSLEFRADKGGGSVTRATATKAAAANNNNNNNNNNKGNAAANPTCLNSNALQTASASDGGPAADAGQKPSETDPANFINVCSGLTLTNGLQTTSGSCNGVPMGKIPAKTNMISAVFVNPQNNQNIAANQDFTISVQVQNLAAGTFTNAANTYYSAPQDLTSGGQIIGHTHVTVQDLGKTLNPTTPLDATQFAFFKGINDAGNGKGLLSAAVAGGLPAGNYRVCSMTSAANHQPVLMPVAQRGAQDDCVRFTVGGNGGGGNTGNNNNAGNNNNGAAATAKATTTAKAASTAAASAGGAVAGIAAPAVTNSGDSTRPFAVNGNTFVNEAAAKQRACDIQNNACSNAVNGGSAGGATIADCQAQQTACNAA